MIILFFRDLDRYELCQAGERRRYYSGDKLSNIFLFNICSFYVYSINFFQTIPTWFNILYSACSSSYAVCKLPNFPSCFVIKENIFLLGGSKNQRWLLGSSRPAIVKGNRGRINWVNSDFQPPPIICLLYIPFYFPLPFVFVCFYPYRGKTTKRG